MPEPNSVLICPNWGDHDPSWPLTNIRQMTCHRCPQSIGISTWNLALVKRCNVLVVCGPCGEKIKSENPGAKDNGVNLPGSGRHYHLPKTTLN